MEKRIGEIHEMNILACNSIDNLSEKTESIVENVDDIKATGKRILKEVRRKSKLDVAIDYVIENRSPLAAVTCFSVLFLLSKYNIL